MTRAIIKLLVRLAWFGLVPLALALAAFRWLVPSPGPGTGLVALIRDLGSNYGLDTTLVFFVIFAALVHYWRSSLPGAQYLAPALTAEPQGSLNANARPALKGAALLLLSVALAVVAALVFRSVVGLYEVTSSSMLPTLLRKDQLIVSKRAYRAHPPRRGDVIVFSKRVDGKEQQLVKRVIGLPGDRITMDGALPVYNGKQASVCHAGRYVHLGADTNIDGHVFVERLDGVAFLTVYAPVYHSDFKEYVVKPGEVFVLGDDRNDSSDSRAWSEAPGVPFESITGRVERLLVGAPNAGQLDVSTLFRPLGTRFDLGGIAARTLEEGIRRCVAEPGAK